MIRLQEYTLDELGNNIVRKLSTINREELQVAKNHLGICIECIRPGG